jgi:pilus assembly protein CpaE
MPPTLTIVIIDPDRESRKSIESIIAPYGDKIIINDSVDSIQDGLRAIQSTHPIVTILAINDLEQGIRDIQSIFAVAPQNTVFVTTAEKNPDWILKLIRAGAQEYLLKPLEPNELLEGLQKAGRLYIDRSPKKPVASGKVISVYNPIGGMGTTTIAVNLAAALAQKSQKVALVDLNFFSGDAAIFLDLNPKYTLTSLTANVSRLDDNFLMSVMARHESGIYLLSDPLDVDETVGITPEQIERIIVFLKSIFEYVIIDTSGPLHGINQTTFEASNRIIYNTILSLPALKNAHRYMMALHKHGVERGKLMILINRYLSRSDIKIADAEKILGQKIFTTIPNEYSDVNDSINKGKPLVNLYPRSPVSKAIMDIAATFQS